MTTWFTSDTHFGHKNIIEYCQRGMKQFGRTFTDVEEMFQVLVGAWNSKVLPHDEVYHLGDFAMGPSTEWPRYASALNGRKHLIFGNHDCDESKYRKTGVWTPRPKIYECGFLSIQEELYINYRGVRIWMAHFPYGETDSKRGYSRPKAKQQWDVALNGHVHDAWLVNKSGSVNVGVDVWGLFPQTFEDIITGTEHLGQILPNHTFLK
jgi:calcineurin-like phosphoesterase family protein